MNTFVEKGEKQVIISKDITIKIPSGLEAEPIAMLVQVACQYDSSIYIQMQDKKINAKSIMGMMSLEIIEGETVTVVADGSDEAEALDNIEKYLTGNH